MSLNTLSLRNNNYKINKKSCKITLLDKLFIVYNNGKIKRKMKSGKWKEIKNNVNHNQGYNVIMVNKHQFTRSQIIAHIFLKYDIFNKDNIKNKMVIYKDKNKMNCSVSNLLVTNKTYYLHC